MDIKIVEYDRSYASKVADMWNKSQSNFGRESIKTEEEVINEESNSGNLKVFLALNKEEVIGYCSFSEYRMDEDASYLPLLITFNMLVDNEEIIYRQSVSALFKGTYGKYYGKINQNYMVCKYVCSFNHKTKALHFKDNVVIEDSSVILPVKIGLPYSLEFNRLSPDEVDFSID